MSRLRVATVGAGYFSRFQYSAWKRLEEVELIAVCNRTAKGAEEISSKFGIPYVYEDFCQMLDECQPDLVDVITPPETHISFVKEAVKRDIPVICQKPFTPSYQEASQLVEFITANKGKVIIHENFRFQPWYHKIRELLDLDTLGQLFEITFSLRPGDGQGPDAYLDRQPYFQQMKRFLVHETAVHLIDVFRYLFGEVSSIYADLRRVNPSIAGEDAGLILFQFINGARGIFDGNRLSDHAATNRRLTMGEMKIEGAKGTLTLNGDGEIFLRRFNENEWEKIDYNWHDNDFGGDCVYRFQRHVVDHFTKGHALMNSAQDYLTNIKIADAAYKANEREGKVSIGETL
ncbi:MAG: Gfo/Idh/MocA family oxidoreductase [Sneathiellales bacterium]|nr:Gfo/Idh/MocA family oxidoreductase [Sneathiellales bacterium]